MIAKTFGETVEIRFVVGSKIGWPQAVQGIEQYRARGHRVIFFKDTLQRRCSRQTGSLFEENRWYRCSEDIVGVQSAVIRSQNVLIILMTISGRDVQDLNRNFEDVDTLTRQKRTKSGGWLGHVVKFDIIVPVVLEQRVSKGSRYMECGPRVHSTSMFLPFSTLHSDALVSSEDLRHI